MSEAVEIKDRIICGDVLEVLPKLPEAQCLFADPPDNIGLQYDTYRDSRATQAYERWLARCCGAFVRASRIFYLSVNAQHEYNTEAAINLSSARDFPRRKIIWFFTFGQHRQHDLANNYRPIFRVQHPQAKLYPDHIRVPSARQLKYNDKRADARGRIPGDVWEFSRICGSFKERRKWHPTQHPEALVERAILMTTRPGDLVIDPFLGSGTTLRVCQRIGRRCVGIDISENYCQRVSEETGVPWAKLEATT